MRNPYDRRDTDRSNGAGLERMHVLRSEPVVLQAPHGAGVTVADLDQIAQAAFHRGRAAATTDLVAQHRDEIQTARRQAWEEGRVAGLDEALATVNERVERRLIETDGRALGVLGRVHEDPRRVTKRELEMALDATLDTLRDLHSTMRDVCVGRRPS